MTKTYIWEQNRSWSNLKKKKTDHRVITFKAAKPTFFLHNWNSLLVTICRSSIQTLRKVLYLKPSNVPLSKLLSSIVRYWTWRRAVSLNSKCSHPLKSNHVGSEFSSLLPDYMSLVLSCSRLSWRRTVLKLREFHKHIGIGLSHQISDILH